MDDYKLKPPEQPKAGTTPNLLDLIPPMPAPGGLSQAEIDRRAMEIVRSGLRPVLPDIAIGSEPVAAKARAEFWMKRMDTKDKDGFLSVAEIDEAGLRASNKPMADRLLKNFKNIRSLSDDELLPETQISPNDLEILFSIEEKMKSNAENFKTKYPKLDEMGRAMLGDFLSALANGDMDLFSNRVITIHKSNLRTEILDALTSELNGSQLRVSYDDKTVKLQHRILVADIADLPSISISFGNAGITDYYTGSRRSRKTPEFTFEQMSKDTLEHFGK